MDLNLTTRQPPLMNSTKSMILFFFEYMISLFFTMLLGKVILSSNPKKKIFKLLGIFKENVWNTFNIMKERMMKKKQGLTVRDEVEILKQRMDEESVHFKRVELSLKNVEERTEERVDDIYEDIESRIAYLIDQEKKERNQSLADVESKIAFLREDEQRNRSKSLEQILERILFLERVPTYLAWISVPYDEKQHIPVQNLIKMMYNGITIQNALDHYLQNEWMGWTTHASEKDLLQFCFSVAQMPLKLCEGMGTTYIKILPGISIYGGITQYGMKNGYESFYSYHKRLNVFKTYRDQWLSNFPNNISNLPEKEKSFAVGYFKRVENVLNTLYEKKLLN
jgi:hypothetical protein